ITRAQSKVSKPTTAPIMSFGPSLVRDSGRNLCRTRPSVPPRKTTIPMIADSCSGLLIPTCIGGRIGGARSRLSETGIAAQLIGDCLEIGGAGAEAVVWRLISDRG